MRNLMRLKIPISVLALLVIVFAISCSTITGAPDWVLETPRGFKDIIYIVAGPSESLSDARLEIYNIFSSYLKTEIASNVQVSTKVSYDEVTRSVDEQTRSWLASLTDTVVMGLKEEKRWFDRRNSSWWILASIDESDLILSIQATAENITSRKEIIAQNSAEAVHMVQSMLSYLHQKDSRNRLLAISDTLSSVQSLKYANQLYGEVEGKYWQILTYLENLMNQELASITVKSMDALTQVYQNASNTIEFFACSENSTTLGILDWDITDENQTLLARGTNTSDGRVSAILPSESFSSLKKTKSIINIKLNLDFLGIFNADTVLVPSYQIPIEIRRGRYCIEILQASPELYLDVYGQLQNLISQVAPPGYLEEKDGKPTLQVVVNLHEGSSNKQMFSYRAALLFKWLFNDAASLTYITLESKGFWSDPERAKKEALSEVLIKLSSDGTFKEFLALGFN